MPTMKVPSKNKRGAPSKFDSIDKEQFEKLVKEGFTDKKIADFSKIHEATLHRWKLSNKDFCESIKDWKAIADQEVEQSLFKRAKGFNAKFKRHMTVNDGRDAGSHIEEVIDEVVFAPDPTSCIFWLKNRQPRAWRDKIDHQISGDDSWQGIVDVIDGAKGKAMAGSKR